MRQFINADVATLTGMLAQANGRCLVFEDEEMPAPLCEATRARVGLEVNPDNQYITLYVQRHLAYEGDSPEVARWFRTGAKTFASVRAFRRWLIGELRPVYEEADRLAALNIAPIVAAPFNAQAMREQVEEDKRGLVSLLDAVPSHEGFFERAMRNSLITNGRVLLTRLIEDPYFYADADLFALRTAVATLRRYMNGQLHNGEQVARAIEVLSEKAALPRANQPEYERVAEAVAAVDGRRAAVAARRAAGRDGVHPYAEDAAAVETLLAALGETGQNLDTTPLRSLAQNLAAAVEVLAAENYLYFSVRQDLLWNWINDDAPAANLAAMQQVLREIEQLRQEIWGVLPALVATPAPVAENITATWWANIVEEAQGLTEGGHRSRQQRQQIRDLQRFLQGELRHDVPLRLLVEIHSMLVHLQEDFRAEDVQGLARILAGMYLPEAEFFQIVPNARIEISSLLRYYLVAIQEQAQGVQTLLREHLRGRNHWNTLGLQIAKLVTFYRFYAAATVLVDPTLAENNFERFLVLERVLAAHTLNLPQAAETMPNALNLFLQGLAPVVPPVEPTLAAEPLGPVDYTRYWLTVTYRNRPTVMRVFEDNAAAQDAATAHRRSRAVTGATVETVLARSYYVVTVTYAGVRNRAATEPLRRIFDDENTANRWRAAQERRVGVQGATVSHHLGPNVPQGWRPNVGDWFRRVHIHTLAVERTNGRRSDYESPDEAWIIGRARYYQGRDGVRRVMRDVREELCPLPPEELGELDAPVYFRVKEEENVYTDYAFKIVRHAGAWRAVLETVPDYGRRNATLEATHRLTHERNYRQNIFTTYVCWTEPLLTERHCRNVAALWSQMTLRYIETGQGF